MKIVIDIPEEDYLNLIKTDENGEKEIPLSLLMSLWDCVKYNCTPLPKNHGRLIDADVLVEGMEDNYELCMEVNATPTIIPSEREEEK